MKEKKKHKYDIIIILLIIAAGAVMALVLFMSKKSGTYVQVRVDSEVVREFDLNTDTEYMIQGANGGQNLLIIKDGEAFVSEASCPDELCIKMGRISNVGESVICLPNRVVVEIISDDGKKTPAVDFVTG